jgi:hypothetical protein
MLQGNLQKFAKKNNKVELALTFSPKLPSILKNDQAPWYA